MTPSIKSILSQAADILETKGWAQNAFARDKDGKPVMPNSDVAVCFCVLGAIQLAEENKPYSAINALRKYIFKGLYSNYSDEYSCLSKWNDEPGRTREGVISTMRNCAATL